MATTETLNAVLNTRKEFPEPVLAVNPGAARINAECHVYITDILGPMVVTDGLIEMRDAVIHSVRLATGPATGDYWLVHDGGIVWMCHGYPLTEAPVNGAHYRTLDHGVLVRYNDDDHMGDRHQPSQPYSLVASHTGPWPLPNDALYPDGATDYPPMVRVIYEGEVSVDRQEYITDLTPRGFTRGLAETEDDGRVLKNPEPVPGEVYLLWDEADGENVAVFVVTYNNGSVTEGVQFDPCGYIRRPDGDDTNLTVQHTSSMYIDPGRRAWVRAHFGVPGLTEEQLHAAADQVPGLRAELARERDKFAEFGDALNEIAEDHGWCEAYDTIVRELGLPGREKDYWVEVEAEVTITDDSPSSNMDDRLEREYGVSISSTYIEIRGKVKVRVGGITASSTDQAHENVTESDVESEVESIFSGSDVSLGEWEITDSGQED